MPSRVVGTVSFRSGEDEISNSFLSGLAQGSTAAVPSRRSLVAIYRAFLGTVIRTVPYEILDERYCCHSARRVLLGPRGRARERDEREKERKGGKGVWNEWCLFITNYLNGSDFGGPAGRLTSKWRVRRSQ